MKKYLVLQPVYRYFTTIANTKITVKFTDNADLDK